MGSEWSGPLREARGEGREVILPTSEADGQYHYIKCSTCPYKSMCPYGASPDNGCAMRKHLYATRIKKIEFRTDDPVTINVVQTMMKYLVEMQLTRDFGMPMTSKEVQMLKTILSELGKLYIDRKGDLVDEKSKTAVPWLQDPELLKMKKEIEDARAEHRELEELRVKLKEKEKPKDVRAEENLQKGARLDWHG